ncbi:MAG: transcription termination factor Rho [Planctomycetes bacterium]|nr:transcription termination factor Rho [Planctomycetota bacterium]
MTETNEKKDNMVTGTFEPSGERGGGYLRLAKSNYRTQSTDAFVPEKLRVECNLRGGETIMGEAAMSKGKPAQRSRQGRNGSRNRQLRSGQGRSGQGRQNQAGQGPRMQLQRVETINGQELATHAELAPFEDLTAISPELQLRFSTEGGPTSMRVVDLMAPIGFGQRGLIVAPPRTGKTVMLQQMAHGIATNHPDAYMMVLLIDERPEEVTDMRRTVNGEVIASSNDEDTANHLRLARLMIAKAKRHVELGENVVILLDSLTRLGRAFNVGSPGRGRTMSGGLDISALLEPKAIFGAARKIEDGGSLTIIASSLIETGSRMDDVIFNEFKGTGNMEIMLSRKMADRRVWPAIDLVQSGTRKEELLLDEASLKAAYAIRRTLTSRNPIEAMDRLTAALAKYPDNAAFVREVLGGQY